MKQKHLTICITACLLVMACGKSSAAFTKENDVYPLTYLQKNLTLAIVNDNFSPPVAARDYVYPHLAAYYILSYNEKGKKIYESIDHFPIIRTIPKSGYSASLAAAYAFYEVARKLIYTEKAFTDSFHLLLNWYKKNGVTPAIQASSRLWAESVAKELMQWLNIDGFLETRRQNKYILLNTPGKWQLTPPGYFPAVEPHWGDIRPLLVSRLDGIQNFVPKIFDTSSHSDFFQQAKTVYDISTSLTTEQKEIAAFWDCNPFALQATGHAQHFVKKMSPGGHWVHISLLACTLKKLNIKETSKVVTLTAIALFDTFIQTWQLKYKFNTLRPETFIEQSGMDATWQPFIQSPPFPEFPSGHASISAAAAGVLTAYFGKDFVYTDNTETSFGLPERSFHSFKEAAKEASISRVYGGIHFPYSCTAAEKLGEQLAASLLEKIGKN